MSHRIQALLLVLTAPLALGSIACEAHTDGAFASEDKLVQHTPLEAAALVKAFYGTKGPVYVDGPTGLRATDRAKLTPELADRLSHYIFSPDDDGVDFLCAQDIPQAIAVEEPQVLPGDVRQAEDTAAQGGDALVTVRETFGGGEQVTLQVRVRLADLKIAGWICAGQKHTALEAHAVVEKFYGDPNESYFTSKALASNYREHLRNLPPEYDADPMLCAQNDPLSFVVDPAIELGTRAVMTVRETFGGNTIIAPVVSVSLADLKINASMCDDVEGGYWNVVQ